MTTLVRDAKPTDAEQLLSLIRQHAAYEGATALADEDDIASLLRALQPPVSLIVAEDGGRLAGYAALTFDFSLWSASRFAHLDCLFVSAAARGQGVGKLLFDHACRVAQEAGAPRIEWQTPSWNVEAIRFYDREGGTGQLKMRFSKEFATA